MENGAGTNVENNGRNRRRRRLLGPVAELPTQTSVQANAGQVESLRLDVAGQQGLQSRRVAIASARRRRHRPRHAVLRWEMTRPSLVFPVFRSLQDALQQRLANAVDGLVDPTHRTADRLGDAVAGGPGTVTPADQISIRRRERAMQSRRSSIKSSNVSSQRDTCSTSSSTRRIREATRSRVCVVPGSAAACTARSGTPRRGSSSPFGTALASPTARGWCPGGYPMPRPG